MFKKIILVLALVIATTPAANAAGTKVQICHVTGSASNPNFTIEVSENAVPAQLQQGSFVIDVDHPCSDSIIVVPA